MRQLFRELVIAKDLAMQHSDERIAQAWVTAGLMRAKKFPELRTLTSQRYRQQTPEEQRVAMQQISARFGLTLRTVPRDGQ